MKKSKTLVLGASGFLGLNLIRSLIDKGEYPRILVRPGYSFSRLQSMSSHFELRVGDFQDDFVLEQSLEGIETVYHLVTTTFPSTALHSSYYDVSTNLLPTIRLIEASLKHSVSRIVYASSGGTIYGEPLQTPIHEDHPLHPVSAYGQSKYMVESYLNFYARTSKLKVNVLRISNPYGEEQKPFGFQGIVAAAMNAAHTGEKISIIGDGSAVRDYLYIQDVIQALQIAGNSDSSWVLNISSGIGRSTNEIIATIEKISGKKILREMKPARVGDVQTNILDNRKALEKIGWQPLIGLEEGLRRTWKWFSSNR